MRHRSVANGLVRVPVLFRAVVLSAWIIPVTAFAATTQAGPALFRYGVFATSDICGSITFTGAITDSFDSSLGTYAATKQNTGGNVGANGNITLSGGATVNGTASSPHGGTTACSNGSISGLSTSGGASAAGGLVVLAGPIPYAAPPAPNPLPPTVNQSIAGLCGTIAGCTVLNGTKDLALAPGSYGNVAVSGGTPVHLTRGTYNLNSLALSGNSALVIDSTPVVLNVAGRSMSTNSALNFSGGVLINPASVAAGLQIVYAGTLPIQLSGGSTSFGVVYAPNAPIALSGGGGWYGALIGSTVTANIAVHYDRALGNAPLAITATPDPAPNVAGWNNTNVTVNFSCSGILVTSCTSPVSVTTEGADQLVSGSAKDIGGNTVMVSMKINLDKTPPGVSASRLPLANAKGWNNTSVTVNFSGTDSLSGLASCSAPVTLANEGASQSTSGTCADKAGNTSPSFAVTGINIDKTSPVIAISSPANGATVTTTSLAVTGTETDPLSGTGAVTCNGTAATLSGPNFSCSVPLTPGSNPINVVANDVAGNSAASTVTVMNSSQSSITMVMPQSAQKGQIVIVTVTGVNSHFAQSSSTVDFGSGTTADSITVNGPLSLTARVTVDRIAIAGMRTLAVNTGSENLSLAGALNVLDGPTISATVDRPPNAEGWYNGDVTVTYTCSDSVSGIATCPSATVVSTEGKNQVIAGKAINNAGIEVTATVTLSIDKTPPAVILTAPTDGSILLTPTANVSATVSDALSGIISATCGGSAAQVNAGAVSCSPSLTLGPHSIAVMATDVAGNSQTATLQVTYSSAPKVKITSPVTLSYLSLSPTTVTGTVDDPTAVVTVNSLGAPVSNGQFSVTVPLAEGPTIITAAATAAGGAVGTDSIEVTLDTTPPHVHVTSPPDHFVTAESTLSVAGVVNDIVVGTVNDQQAQVTVNGLIAQVSNRTFLAASVPLAIGDNVIRAVARDRVGNTVAEEITVTRQAATTARIRVISGNNQAGPIGAALTAPLVAGLVDASGNPVANKKVIFKVVGNDGLVTAGGTPAPSLIALTNALGEAQAQWTLGMRAGAGGNNVEAYAVGFDGTATFSATGTAGAGAKIVVDTGNGQIGAAGQPLPRPLIAVVIDPGNNRLANIPVTFTVKEGGGSFAGNSSFTINTDSDGRAAAILTLGLQEGNANNVVLAGFAGNPGLPVSFTASGRAAGDPSKTTLTGVVLDNSNIPIPGVTIRAVLTSLFNSNRSIVSSLPAVQTDAQGQFVVNQAPVGDVKLLIDGLTANRPGTYPMLEYDFVTVAGQDNSVGQPIYLLALNEQNKLCVTATTGGGTLTVADTPGFSLTFVPGQVTFPGGSKEGCVSVTIVHGDKVPMSPGFGQQPRFIVTIQPAGALFNPPATITMPNVDGLRPREVTEMYSFDHDINSFVAIGTGIVSDDGQVIRSSPGVGVLKAGWHCGGNPNSTGSAGNCAQCRVCDGVSCVPDPAASTCDDGKFCTDGDHCSNGNCLSGAPKPDIPGPSLAASVNIDAALAPIQGFLTRVFGGGAPNFSFTISGTKQDTEQCCERTRGMVTSTTGSIAISANIATPDIPIPGAAISLPFGISAGLFANLVFTAGGSLSGTLDGCTNVPTGSLGANLGLSGTIKAQLTLPANLAAASAGGTIGASCTLSAPIQSGVMPVTGTCGHDGIIVSVTAEFGGGIIQVSSSYVVMPPDTLGSINFQIPSPF